MQKHANLASGIALGVLIGFFYFTAEPRRHRIQEQQSMGLPMKPAMITNGHAKEMAANPEGDTGPKEVTITKAEITTLKEALPDKNEVKREVAADPEQPPKSLINFAQLLGPLVEKGIRNSKDAELLVNELHNCALDESVINSARAQCLYQEEKLANVHSALKEKVEKTRGLASFDVLKLVDSRKALMK